MNIQNLWNESWERQKALTTASSTLPEASWRTGGRASKAYPLKENETWWQEHGPQMLQSWIDWRKNGWKLWVEPLSGNPAVELALNPQFGGVMVKMVIDRIFVTPDGELIILDLKSGRTEPNPLQLAFYAAGVEKIFGIRPKYGTYWMARSGTTTELVDLDNWDSNMIESLVTQFNDARNAGIFLPNHSTCKMCSVTEHCKWYKGE